MAPTTKRIDDIKCYFVGYTESRNKLKLSSSPVLESYLSFNEGVSISRSSGFSRKRDAVKRVNDVNLSAGKEIAYYHGSATV
jgi:hypothetical protein